MKRSLLLVLACMILCLTGCTGITVPVEKAEDYTSSKEDGLLTGVVVQGTGSFVVKSVKEMVTDTTVQYSVYSDLETGGCFAELYFSANSKLLIPLINADGTYKEYSDSNMNIISCVGTPSDMHFFIIKDNDTNVQYVISGTTDNYFVRRNLDGSVYLD